MSTTTEPSLGSLGGAILGYRGCGGMIDVSSVAIRLRGLGCIVL